MICRGKVEMIVVMFDSHMVVACFGFVMFGLLGHSKRMDGWC